MVGIAVVEGDRRLEKSLIDKHCLPRGILREECVVRVVQRQYHKAAARELRVGGSVALVVAEGTVGENY